MSNDNPVMLTAEALSVARGRGANRQQVLRDIQCRIRVGEVVMLLGPNGAGKTTLLEALAGDVQLAQGRVCLAGKALVDWPAPVLARRRAMLRQRSNLNLDFSVEEVVALGCLPRRDSPAQQRELIHQAMAMTGVGHLARRSVLSLSGGEQARAHLARTLAQLWPLPGDADDFPRLLLLDEPCASLDPFYQHQVCRLIRDFARQRGCAVVTTMHDMNLAAQYADSVMLLRNGGLVGRGPVEQVLTRQRIRDCFKVDCCQMQAHNRLLLATRALA